MLDSAPAALLLIMTGLLTLRPRDFPLFARFAGRLAGASVRGLRGLSSATEAALHEGERALGAQGADAGVLRDELRKSWSAFDRLRVAVTKDVAGARRDGPGQMIRRKMMQMREGEGGERGGGGLKLVARTEGSGGEERMDGKGESTVERRRASVGAVKERLGERTMAGSDFIAKSIEEAALARQQQRIFGRTMTDNDDGGVGKKS